MTQITLKGNTLNTIGSLPAVGSVAKDFKLTATDLSTKTLADFKGQKLVLNIFPSISRDLPFAQKRFCGAEGIENVVMLSDFNTGSFGKDYGLIMIDGALSGLLSRSIVVIDENGVVKYTEQVAETTEEPNYQAALNNL